MAENESVEEYDYHPMWEGLGMDVPAHDGLLGAVGQMYGSMFLTQKNRPASTSYLDFVASNIHSGRIKEMLDKKASGEAKKIIGSFCLYVPEEIVTAAGGIPVGLCAGADWATDKVEDHLPAHQGLHRLQARARLPLHRGFRPRRGREYLRRKKEGL